jgi:hypothetical protein
VIHRVDREEEVSRKGAKAQRLGNGQRLTADKIPVFLRRRQVSSEGDRLFAPSRSENRQVRQERQGSLDCAPIVLQAKHADSGQEMARVSSLLCTFWRPWRSGMAFAKGMATKRHEEARKKVLVTFRASLWLTWDVWILGMPGCLLNFSY